MGISTSAKDSQVVRYGASQTINSIMAASGVQTVVSAAANVNGLIVHRAGYFSQTGSGGGLLSLLAKTSSPGNSADGDMIMGPGPVTGNVGSGTWWGGSPIFVPAGKGLYFFSQYLETVGCRWVLYTLL